MRGRLTKKGFTAEAGLELLRGHNGRMCNGGEKGGGAAGGTIAGR